MGVVYRAHDELTGETVALKRMRSDAPDVARFRREAKLLSRVRHPSVVRYVAHGDDDAGPWVAMEWSPGRDLDAHLAGGRLPVATAAAIAVDLAEALVAIHQLGIVHRDLKPANVLVASEAPLRIKLVDFGIAHDASASMKLTKTGTALGTPLYMAPEQIRGSDVSDRTDVYALGAILFEMIAGRPPFDGESSLAVLGRILLEPAPPLRVYAAEVAPAIEGIVRACLAKEPSARPSAEALVTALRSSDIGLDRTIAPIEDTVAATRPAVAALVGEQRAAAVLVIRDAPREEVRRFEGTHGSSWDTLRDGTVFGLFVDARSPDTASTRATRVALAVERAAEAARSIVCVGRVADDTRSFVGEIFQRAASIDPPSPGTWTDAASAEILARRFRVEDGDRGLVRVREPEAEHDHATTPTVGRGAEQAQLEALVRSVMEEGRPRVALVIGPPGRGKSRLCRDLRRAAKAITGNDAILVELDPLSPSTPWSALGLGVARLRSAGDVAALEDAALRRIGREERDGDDELLRAVASDADAWRDLLRASMDRLVRNAAGSSAAVVLVEDMHWADAATVRLLDELAASDDLPIAIVAFARPEVEARFPSVWARRNPLRVELGPIARRSAEQLVRAIAPKIDPADLDRIVALAAGGPLVLEELARYWLKHGRVAPTSSAKQVFEAELALLEIDERLVLRAASLVGEVFWSGCVAEILRDVPLDVSAMLDRFEQAKLVARQPSRLAGEQELRVRHALLREAAVEAIGDNARRRLHAGAAVWLDRAGAEHVLVAHHAEHGGRHDIAVRAYEAAARAAADDAETAGSLYARAIALLPDGTTVADRARLLLALEDAQRALGNERERARCLAELAALAVTSRSDSLRIAVRNARHAVDRRDTGVSMKALDLAVDARREDAPDIEGEAMVVVALGLRDSKDPDHALAVLRRALDEASDRFSGTVGAEIHRILGILLRRTGDVHGAIAAYERAAELAGDAAGPSSRVLISLGYLQLVQGWLADAHTTFLRARAAVDRVHLRRDQARIAGNLAHLAIVLGDLTEASEHLKRALYFHAAGVDLDAQVETLCLCVQAALDMGDDDRAAADLARASELVPTATIAYDDVRVRWLLGRFAFRRGDLRSAIASLDETIDRARKARLVGLATVGLAERARARHTAGDADGALADGREALALLDSPPGADFAAEAFEALVGIPLPGFADVGRRWIETRLDRAGERERERLARHPRTRRIVAALG